MNNMSYEIIEAIESYYKGDEDMIAECMLWLSEAKWKGMNLFWQWLDAHCRCSWCGSKLKQQEYKEPHTEIGNGVYETLYEWYCPSCEKDVN